MDGETARDGETFAVRAFARLAGVTVRTLQYYDNVGLLTPSHRTTAGHRRYLRSDLLRLQQILTLRYLGFALTQIRAILSRPDFDLAASLAVQRQVVRDRIGELERIDGALGAMLARRHATGHWEWDLVTHAAAAARAGLEQRGGKMDNYYSPEELRQRLAEMGQQLAPDAVRQTEHEWTAIVHEVRASLDLNPTSAEARALAARWNALVRALAGHFQGDPKLAATLRQNYVTGAYTSIPDAPTMAEFAFIERVNQANTGDDTP
jgi:DNA-binding transcriptional MerR regulator